MPETEKKKTIDRVYRSSGTAKGNLCDFDPINYNLLYKLDRVRMILQSTPLEETNDQKKSNRKRVNCKGRDW